MTEEQLRRAWNKIENARQLLIEYNDLQSFDERVFEVMKADNAIVVIKGGNQQVMIPMSLIKTIINSENFKDIVQKRIAEIEEELSQL